jgi:hypothetical protein
MTITATLAHRSSCIPKSVILCLTTLSPLGYGQSLKETSVQPFVNAICVHCHDPDSKSSGLDLTNFTLESIDVRSIERWAKVYDRVRLGEMPPQPESRPSEEQTKLTMEDLAKVLSNVDKTRLQSVERHAIRRMSRIEFENSLRDLLQLPGLNIVSELPADGRSHGFDRSAAALDLSFVHMDKLLTAIDRALNEATPAFANHPPTFRYRYRPWDNNCHEGREAEGAVVLNVDAYVRCH